MNVHEVLTDYISGEVPPKLLERGDPLFVRAAPEGNAPMRCVAEFRNAGRVRDQELHIAVGGDVSDLIGPEHGMNRNKDRVGPKHPRIATTWSSVFCMQIPTRSPGWTPSWASAWAAATASS